MLIVQNVDVFTAQSFHADEITPLSVTPGEITPGDVDFTVSEVYFDFPRTFVHVQTEEGFVAGKNYSVRVNFVLDTIIERFPN